MRKKIEFLGLNEPHRFGFLRQVLASYLLQLSGVSGQTYQIQISTDLLNWLDWTNALGPTWQTVLPTLLPAKPPQQFYRAIEQ
jgi:hypothetical protein